MATRLDELQGSHLYELEARDLRKGPFPRYEKVRLRADTRADAIARLVASDFEPLLDGEDLSLSDEKPAPQPPIAMPARPEGYFHAPVGTFD